MQALLVEAVEGGCWLLRAMLAVDIFSSLLMLLFERLLKKTSPSPIRLGLQGMRCGPCLLDRRGCRAA